MEAGERQDAHADPPRDARRGGVLSGPVAYLDSSACVKLFLAETESAEIRRYLTNEWQLVSASVVVVEVLRALRRAGAGEDAISRARQVLDRVHLRWATDELLVRAGMVDPRHLRSLDAIHLATALDLAPPPSVFLCYDARLGDAARAHGLPVLAPGADEVHEP